MACARAALREKQKGWRWSTPSAAVVCVRDAIRSVWLERAGEAKPIRRELHTVELQRAGAD